jgi:hypothetical protein
LGLPSRSLKKKRLGADTESTMAAEELPDFDELLAELHRLESDERELSAVRRKLHDRVDLGFPNELTLRREREISDERRALHRRIAVLHNQLAPFMRTKA